MADYDLNDPEQVKLYLKNIETEYSYQCLSEKEPDGCHRLADFINCIKKDEVMGTKLYKMTCDDYKYGHSCFKYAGQRILGKGTEANAEEGLAYFEKSCEYGFDRGCSNAGMLCLKGDLIKQDYEKGLKYLSISCKRGRGEACSALGTAHLTGMYGLKKQVDTAIPLLEKGCEMESFTGCANLSRLYKTGDGVQRNDALAHKYKELAQKIKLAESGKFPGIQLGRTN